MRKIILVGCENSKRTDFFLKAATELQVPVLFEDIYKCEPEKLGEAIVKVDPFVYQDAEIERMEGALEQYTHLLNRFAANKGLCFLNHPFGIQEVLHKVKCKERLMEHEISTTRMIGVGIPSLNELRQLMIAQKEYAVFIKPVRSSGAVGIAAYRFLPTKNREILYTSAYLEGEQLINTKKLYRIEDKEQIRRVLDKILSMETMIERWYSKTDYQGKKYDLRVVWQFGQIDFIVARQSKGPITNLHLNNQALSIENLCLSIEKQEKIAKLCACAMEQFPTLSYAGIDIMLDKDSQKPRIIEINGQGDLLYQDIYHENRIYKNQILYMCQKAQK